VAPKRRSARLSADGNENQDEPPSKKARVNAAQGAEAEGAVVKKKGRKKGRFACLCGLVEVGAVGDVDARGHADT